MSDEHGLVMPFVNVTSTGGAFDDNAYAAGWEMGRLDRILETSWDDHNVTLRASNRQQADLIAMRHGFVSEFTPTGLPEWVQATFRPAGDRRIPGEQ